MEKFYTSKQVQDLFKVDRITVYRMLQDGRLKGVKIGTQWRFPESEIERLLGGDTAVADMDPEVDTSFPVHCVQTIQDLFSSVSQVSALVVDQFGNLVTEISKPSRFCQMILSTPAGKDACQRCWSESARQGISQNKAFTCHAGLNYVGTSIVHDREAQGMFLMGEIYLKKPNALEAENRYEQLAQTYGLSAKELKKAALEIPVFDETQRNHLTLQPAAAARAIESILNERGGFLKRLQEIANLTQNL
jgi:excisionase family DNA binding protein